MLDKNPEQIIDNDLTQIQIKFEEKEKTFDPEVVYKGQPNPTKI